MIMLIGNKQSIEGALISEKDMDSYLEGTPSNQIIADIKAYANHDRANIAAMAMQGWLSSWPADRYLENREKLAEASVSAADALINELNKTK